MCSATHGMMRTGDRHQACQGSIARDDEVPDNHPQGEVVPGHGDEQGGQGASSSSNLHARELHSSEDTLCHAAGTPWWTPASGGGFHCCHGLMDWPQYQCWMKGHLRSQQGMLQRAAWRQGVYQGQASYEVNMAPCQLPAYQCLLTVVLTAMAAQTLEKPPAEKRPVLLRMALVEPGLKPYLHGTHQRRRV